MISINRSWASSVLASGKVSVALRYPAPEPVHSAGVTDGSIMAEVGLPTLDSMGARGGGAHTDAEYIELPSLSERATLAAILLRQLAREAPETPEAPPEAGLPSAGAKLESGRPSPPVIAGSRPVVGP